MPLSPAVTHSKPPCFVFVPISIPCTELRHLSPLSPSPSPFASQVSNSNPYEDFDAIHDRQLPVDHGKNNCGGPLGFLAFCRPRSGTFHNNPSTRGSGVEFFPTGSMDDSAELERGTPRGLLGFCTPGSRSAPFNPSTRGEWHYSIGCDSGAQLKSDGFLEKRGRAVRGRDGIPAVSRNGSSR